MNFITTRRRLMFGGSLSPVKLPYTMHIPDMVKYWYRQDTPLDIQPEGIKIYHSNEIPYNQKTSIKLPSQDDRFYPLAPVYIDPALKDWQTIRIKIKRKSGNETHNYVSIKLYVYSQMALTGSYSFANSTDDFMYIIYNRTQLGDDYNQEGKENAISFDFEMGYVTNHYYLQEIYVE